MKRKKFKPIKIDHSNSTPIFYMNLNKAKIEAHYNVICPNEHGINGKEFVTVINRRVKLEKCKKCKYHISSACDEYDTLFMVICDYKGKK